MIVSKVMVYCDKLIMLKVLRLIHPCVSAKPSIGFQAIRNTELQAEVKQHATAKLDALVDVVMSLTNRESEYLNLLMT